MKALLKFRPDLLASELEDRLLPVISNPGVMVLTTGGYVLLTPSLGGPASPGGWTGGVDIPTGFFMTGSGGISSMQPGNNTGVPGLAATGPAGPSGAAGATIIVGSGANDANGPIVPALVTRNTIANDALNPPPRIGRPSGDLSPVLPAGQVYRGGVPETAPAPDSGEAPERQPIRIRGQTPASARSIPPGVSPPRASSDASGDAIREIADRVPR